MTYLGIMNLLWFLFCWLMITSSMFDSGYSLPDSIWKGYLVATVVLFITAMIELSLAIGVQSGGYY